VSLDQPASDRDRRAATRVVEDAFRSGRIIEADRDLRVVQLEQATSMQDVELVVRDLAARLPPDFSVAGPPPPRAPVFRPAPPQRSYAGLVALVLGVVLVVPAVVVVAVLAVRVSPDRVESSSPSSSYAPGEPAQGEDVNVLTVESIEAMVDALAQETGSTSVYRASLYPTFAVIDVPTGSASYTQWYWDGTELSAVPGDELDIEALEVDLAQVDAQRAVDLVGQVRDRMAGARDWYVVADHPVGAEPQLSAWALDEADESSHLVTALDGTVLRDSEAS
jgi:hypothetical protein